MANKDFKDYAIAGNNIGLTYDDINDTVTFSATNTNSVLKDTVKLSTAINKGQAVYVSGADGTNIIVSKASNVTEATSSKTIGLLETSGTTNAIVNVVTDGLLTGLNTSTATIGDPVWLGINGDLIYGLVNKPYAPANLVYMGVVTRVNSNNGEILVKVQNGFELEEVHDVDLKTNAPTNNQVLVYEQATDLWKNKTIPTILGFNPIKTVVRDGNASTTITGNTNEQPIGIYLIPANTYSANDIMRIATLTIEKIGTIGNCFVRVKIGTSATGVGATTIASFTLGSTSLFANITRSSMIIRGGNIRVFNPTTSVLTDVIGTTIAPTNVTFNPAVDNYISTTLQLGSASDSVFQSSFLVTN